MRTPNAPAADEHPGVAARRAYETWHTDVHARDEAADRPWHQLLLRHLTRSDVDGRRLLEIGCGRGELAAHLACGTSKGTPRSLVGADFAVSAVTLAMGRVPGTRATFTAADIERIPFGDHAFDTVISCETIEHVLDPAAALRELYRVLVPGGRLLLTTPNYLGVFGFYRMYLRLRGRRYSEGDQPICHFTTIPRTAWWLRKAGFELVDVDATGHYRLRPGRVPAPSRLLTAHEKWLWPTGLHSLFVARKPRA